MLLLAEFLLRLCFGMAAAMATVSPRQVSSGYFRNHLYVMLGLASLAALLSRSQSGGAFWWAVFAAGLSYAGSVSWLYESPRAGIAALVLTALVAMVAAWYAATEAHAPQSSMAPTTPTPILRDLQIVTSGLLLGATMAAMLLGHWYLNAPGMQLAPLRRLIVAMGRGGGDAGGGVRMRIVARGGRSPRRHGVVVVFNSAVVVWIGGRRGAGGDGVEDAGDSQHAKRDRHFVRRGDRGVCGRDDVAVVVGGSDVSGLGLPRPTPEARYGSGG